jgi:hypothetical protein
LFLLKRTTDEDREIDSREIFLGAWASAIDETEWKDARES